MKSHKKFAYASFILAAITLSGCSWDSSLYNKFQDENHGAVYCSGLKYIIIEHASQKADTDKNKDKDTCCCLGSNGEIDDKCSAYDKCVPASTFVCNEFKNSFTYNICPVKYNTCAGAENEHYCEEKTVTKCESGVICDGNCIDPMRDIKYCGASNECKTNDDKGMNCQNELNDPTKHIEYINCLGGKCLIDKCVEGYHKEIINEQVVCREDSVDKCGDKLVNCMSGKDEYEKFECIKGECQFTGCDDDYHINDRNDGCVEASVENCARLGYDCSLYMAGWESGKCINKVCQAEVCQKGYHVYKQNIAALGLDINVCEYDSYENCGGHGISCDGKPDEGCAEGLKSVCVSGDNNTANCQCSTCESFGLTECDKSCVDINNNVEHCKGCGNACKVDNIAEAYCNQEATETDMGCVVLGCKDGYHLSNGVCKINDDDNCGADGNSCNTDMFEGYCENGKCIIEKCKKGYHLDDGKCETDTVLNCGDVNVNCYEMVGVSKVRCEVGGLTSACVVEECQANYHKKGDVCVADTVMACGADEIACNVENSEFCFEGECKSSCPYNICTSSGSMLCVDINVSDDYCGNCTTKCPQDRSCRNGKCECKDGLSLCNERCVSLNTNNNCGGCGIKCDRNSYCNNDTCVCLVSTNNQICDNKCIPKNDNAHCGSCENVCKTNEKCVSYNNEYKCVIDCLDKKSDQKCDKCNGNSGKLCVNKFSKATCVNRGGNSYCSN